MNLQAAITAPWRATHRSLRWMTLAIFAACCVGAIAIAVFAHMPHWWLISTVIYCFGAGYVWAFLMSSLLLLSIDARELRIAAASAEDRLCDLTRRGMLQPTDEQNYRYAPRERRLDEAVGALASAYSERRVSVINLIFSKPTDRIRTFADAFRVRRD